MVMTPPPEYPFQKTTADLCQIKGNNYLVYADRLTGWIEIAHLRGDTTSNRLIQHLRTYFTRYGAPYEISIDGGTNLNSENMSQFFKKWGVSTRISSAYYPQSNGRAESAVKTAKRVLMDNTGPGGSLDTDQVSVALLQYHNTPLRGINKSPAQLATGRQLRDGIPSHKRHYRVARNWKKTLMDRETKMAEAHQDLVSKQGNNRTLHPLDRNARVWVQDQFSNKWNKSGTVIEPLDHRQYTVKMDGSGRLSKRNRRHLRPISTEAARETPTTHLESQDSHPQRTRHKPDRYVAGQEC